MNSAIIQTLLAGSASRGALTRDSVSSEETALFRDALSNAEGGGRRRGGKDVAEPRPPLGKLAERLAKAMGPLRADESEAVSDTVPADTPALADVDDESAPPEPVETRAAEDDDLPSPQVPSQPLQLQQAEASQAATLEPPKAAIDESGTAPQFAAGPAEPGPDQASGRTSGAAGLQDTVARMERLRDGNAPLDRPPAAAPAPLMEDKPVAVVAATVQEPVVSRAGAEFAAAVGRTFMTRPTAAGPRSAESPSAPSAAGEASPDLISETVDVAEPPRRARAEATLREAPRAPDRDASQNRHDAGEGREAAPARLDAAAVRAPDAAPGAIRPGVTAASVLGPLAADPVLRSTITGSGLLSDPQEAAARPTHSLRIQLRPAELGAVTATLRMTDDQLSVEMVTENVDAYRQLSRDSDTIVAALRGLGLQVDQITIQPPQPAATASARNEGSMSMQNGTGRGDTFGQTGGSSGGNSGAHGGHHSNQGDRDGASLRPSASPARDARSGGGLVI